MNEAKTVKTTHTPGPWVLKGRFPTQYIMHDRDCIATTHISEADARLIAAAPEMLEALLVAQEAVESAAFGALRDPIELVKRATKLRLAAIAKATGEVQS